MLVALARGLELRLQRHHHAHLRRLLEPGVAGRVEGPVDVSHVFVDPLAHVEDRRHLGVDVLGRAVDLDRTGVDAPGAAGDGRGRLVDGLGRRVDLALAVRNDTRRADQIEVVHIGLRTRAFRAVIESHPI